MQQFKNAGAYEFLVMLAATTLGFLGGPLWIAPTAGLLLTLSTFQEHGALQPRLARGGARLMAGAVLMIALTCIVFASICFGIGRGIRWLIV
jgi:hypothetical protein